MHNTNITTQDPIFRRPPARPKTRDHAPHLGIDGLLRHGQDLASIPELLLLLARLLDLLLDPVGGDALDAPARIRHHRGWAGDGGLCGGAAGGGADGGVGEALLPAVRLLPLPGQADLPLDHRLLLHPAGEEDAIRTFSKPKYLTYVNK